MSSPRQTRRTLLAGLVAFAAAPALAGPTGSGAALPGGLALQRLAADLRSRYHGHPVSVTLKRNLLHVVFAEDMLFEAGISFLKPEGVLAMTALAEGLVDFQSIQAEIISIRRQPDVGFKTHITSRRHAVAVAAALQSRKVDPARLNAVSLAQSTLAQDPEHASGADRIHIILSRP
jgi:hypothetical protein